MRSIALATALTLALTTAATAQAAPKGWQTWTWEGSCYAVLFPEDPGVAELANQKAYAAVRHIPAEGTMNSVSFVSGLEDTVGVKGTADIDGKSYNLLVFDGAGFVSSGPREESLLSDLQNGQELRLTWTSDDTMIVQVYKLDGLPQAKKTIDTACLPDSTKTAAAN